MSATDPDAVLAGGATGPVETRRGPRRLAETCDPDQVFLDLLEASLRNLWILVYVNLAVALMIAVAQITVGDPLERALAAFITGCSASMLGSAILLPVAILGRSWMARRPGPARATLMASETVVLAGIGTSALMQTSPTDYGVNVHPTLGLGGAAAITAILATRLPGSAALGRLVLVLPFAIWLLVVQPNLWWVMLAMTAASYGLSVIIALRLYYEALRAADTSSQLRRAHDRTRDLAGRLRVALSSERRKARRLGTEARLRERFLHTVTHDLRQSLCAIALHSRRFGAETEDPRAASHAALIGSVLTTADGMIDSVAQAAWLAEDEGPAELVPTDLGAMLSGLAEEVSPLFEAEGIALRPVPTSLWASAAPNLLDRVLRNLLINALRHSGARRVVVGVRREGDQVRIVVADDGKGIAPDLQARVFERFYQGSDPAARSVGSLGLGLAIVHDLTGRMAGRVTLESLPPQGARFGVILARAIPPVRAARCSTVLVLDDDAASLEALSAAVTRLGARPVPCASMAEARAAPPADAYVCDFFLGGKATAFDLIERLPAKMLPRVLVVSSHLPAPLADRVRARGCHVAAKPLALEALDAFLRTSVEGSQ